MPFDPYAIPNIIRIKTILGIVSIISLIAMFALAFLKIGPQPTTTVLLFGICVVSLCWGIDYGSHVIYPEENRIRQ